MTIHTTQMIHMALQITGNQSQERVSSIQIL